MTQLDDVKRVHESRHTFKFSRHKLLHTPLDANLISTSFKSSAPSFLLSAYEEISTVS